MLKSGCDEDVAIEARFADLCIFWVALCFAAAGADAPRCALTPRARSSVILAIDSPNLGQESPGLKNVLSYADYVFVALFTLELVLKVLVMGLVSHPGSYLRNTWNQLDCFIVVVGLFGMITELRPELSVTKGANVTFLRALRTFRALRPIRMASRAEGMKVRVRVFADNTAGNRRRAEAAISLRLCVIFHTTPDGDGSVARAAGKVV